MALSNLRSLDVSFGGPRAGIAGGIPVDPTLLDPTLLDPTLLGPGLADALAAEMRGVTSLELWSEALRVATGADVFDGASGASGPGRPTPAGDQLDPLLQALGDLGALLEAAGQGLAPGEAPSLDPRLLELLQLLVLLLMQGRGLSDGCATPTGAGGAFPGGGRSPSGSVPSGGSIGRSLSGLEGAPGGGLPGAASSAASEAAGSERTPSRDLGTLPRGRGTVGEFLRAALSQNGDRYVYGAEASPSDANPSRFDCSELVEWAAARAGVRIADGSSNQRATTQRISVEEALRTPGALLFSPGHVAISLGDGRTIEARNSRDGVGIFQAGNRFSSGGLIPGMVYG